MLHKPFRDESELIDCTSYVEAYTNYLTSGNIPPCLQDDIHRLQQSNDSSQEQTEIELVANHHNMRQIEERMILCQQHHQLEAQGAILSNQIDWTEAARAYPNLAEASTFITQNKESTQLACSSSMLADPQLLQGTQLEAYQIVNDHFIHNEDTPLRMVVTGTAGTGKSFLIACLKQLLSSKVRVSAPTGVAAFNVQGCTRAMSNGAMLCLVSTLVSQVTLVIPAQHSIPTESMDCPWTISSPDKDVRVSQCHGVTLRDPPWTTVVHVRESPYDEVTLSVQGSSLD